MEIRNESSMQNEVGQNNETSSQPVELQARKEAERVMELADLMGVKRNYLTKCIR